MPDGETAEKPAGWAQLGEYADELTKAVDEGDDPVGLADDLEAPVRTLLALDLRRGSEKLPAHVHDALRLAQVVVRGQQAQRDAEVKRLTKRLERSKKGEEDDRRVRDLTEQLRVARDELAERKEEVVELQEQVDALEAGGAVSRPSAGSRASIGGDGQKLRLRNTQLQEEINDLKVRNKDLLKDVTRKEEREEELRKLLDNERSRHREDKDERRQLEEDLAQMKEQIRGYRLQLDNTAESVAAREERNREAKKGLRQKTREINNLEEERARLAEELSTRDEELREMVESLDATAAELESEKETAAERARLVDSLENQLSKAEAAEAEALAKVDGLEAELAEEEAEQEAMAKEYEASITELKREVRARGRAIEDRDAKLRELEAKVEALNESRQVVAMREALEELQRRLEDAQAEARSARGKAGDVREVEARAADKLTSAEAAAAEHLAAARAHARAELDRAVARVEEGRAELARQKSREAALGEKLAQREDVIVELRARMGEYEVGVFGLREAVQEAERLRNSLQARDDEVTRMTRERNARESQLHDLADEVTWLRERAGISSAGAAAGGEAGGGAGGETGGTGACGGGSSTGMDLSKLRLRSQMEMERLRSANAALESEVDELEEERLKLKKALRVKALGRGDRAAVLQMSVEKLTALEEMQAGLHDDPDFEHDRVGPRRLRPAPAAGGAARAAVDSSAPGEQGLRERGGAVQPELSDMSARLAEAEAGRRSAERARVSLATDRAELEARVRLLTAAQTGGSAQAAAMRALLGEMDQGIRALSHALQAEAVEAAGDLRPMSASTSRLGARAGADGQAKAAKGQAAAAAAARAAALSARLATRLVEIESAPMPPPPVAAPTTRPPSRAPAAAPATPAQRVDAEAARSAARLRSLQGLAEPGATAETVALPSEIEASDAPPELLMAALSAQLLEALAALAQREQECESLSREARGYSSSFHRIHEQQSVLYASHVRQVKSLSSQLLKAEARAAKAEARASEDRVRIDSWSAMAAALETSGDGAQAAVAGLGRRLTALRVKELTLSRTAAAQAAELDGLRRGRRAAADEARAAAVEAAARAARLERARRELEARLGEATRRLAGAAPREELEAERGAHQALQRAYRSAAEQAARCAGSEHEAVALRAECALLKEQLAVSQSNAHSAAEAAAAAHDALARLGPGSPHLDARAAALEIGRSAALARADAAERVLAQAQLSRQALAERLQAVEAPVAELRAALLAREEELAAARPGSPRRMPAAAGAAAWEVELAVARAELDRSREMERVAASQAAELSARLEAEEAENAALRAAAVQLQQRTDEGVELGRMQWEVMGARRAEAEATRREAASRGRQFHAQAALHRALVELDASHALAADSASRLAVEQAEHARRLAEARSADARQVPLSALEAATAKIEESAARAAAAVARAAEAEREREAVLGELAAAAARDEDQRALLSALGGGGEVVTLAQLSEEKTQHKVAELRLRRRVEALEQAEAREAAAARAAGAAREAAEEALVRAQERLRLVEREAAAREGGLASEASALRAQLSQAQLDAVTRRRPAPLDVPPAGAATPPAGAAPPAGPPPAPPPPSEAWAPSGDWPGGGEASGGVAARAVVLELQTQLSAREAEMADLRSDLAQARTELAQARTELAAEGESLARKEALLAELHASHSAEARAAAEGGASSAEAAIAAAAGAGARQSRLAAVAQQTIAGLHAKVRKHEETEVALRRMLEAGREALRNEKAAAAAEAEKLSERLYQLQRAGLKDLEGALRCVDEAPPPRAADGLELSGAQLEELLIEKDEAIARLQVEAEAAGHEVAALRAHLQEQVAEAERLGGALEAERRREPTTAMHAQLAQLRSLARKKDGELGRMRSAMSELREEMSLVAKENAERSARATALSARLEAKASDREDEARLASRLSALQERHSKLLAEVRALRQREGVSRAQAEGLASQLGQAEALATRQAAEIGRYRTELAAAVGRCEVAESANASLGAQLSLRTDALAAVAGAPASVPPPPGATAEMVQHAVDVAVAVERERWRTTREALTKLKRELSDVRQARDAAMAAAKAGAPPPAAPPDRPATSGGTADAAHAARLSQSEGARELAVEEADRLRGQLRQAEAQLHQLKQRAGAAAAGAAAAASEVEARPPASSGGGASGGGAAGGALERWEAEKRLQRRLEVVRAKLQAKAAELAAAEAELARTREALGEAERREAATRALASEAQGSAARLERERSGAVGEAMAEMRAREALSAELAQAQAALREATAAEGAARTARMEAREAARRAAAESAAAAAGGEEGALHAALVASEERALEASFTVEQLNLSVAQLEARVRDLTAYQAFVIATGETAGGGGRGAARGRGVAPVGREEVQAVVERMGRVIAGLQAENASLQKRAVSSVEHVRVTKEARALRAHVEAMQAELQEARARASSARDEIERASKYQRERDEARRALRAEESRAAELRSRLADETRAREAGEGGQPSEERLQEVRVELEAKRVQVVQLATQLQEALTVADAAERRAAVLAADGQRMAAELDEARRAAGGGGEYAARLEAALEALHTEHAALRRERDSMADELAALTPEFFDEVEDLKFNYAQAQAELERLEAARRG